MCRSSAGDTRPAARHYEELTASTGAKAILAAIFSPGLLFGMGLMFFVAGMFTPRALAAKGPRRFVVDRLWRLGLPTVAYLFVVNPAMNFVGDRVIGTTESVADYFRLSYRHDVEFGIAWFITALLLFSIGFAAWRSQHPARAQDALPLRRQELPRRAAPPATLIPVIEGVIAVTMSLWITDWFRRRWDRASALAHDAGGASFAAYLLHAPITIVLAAALSDVGVPAELKFLAVFAAAVFVSFALGWLLTRSHVGGRIL